MSRGAWESPESRRQRPRISGREYIAGERLAAGALTACDAASTRARDWCTRQGTLSEMNVHRMLPTGDWPSQEIECESPRLPSVHDPRGHADTECRKAGSGGSDRGGSASSASPSARITLRPDNSMTNACRASRIRRILRIPRRRVLLNMNGSRDAREMTITSEGCVSQHILGLRSDVVRTGGRSVPTHAGRQVQFSSDFARAATRAGRHSGTMLRNAFCRNRSPAASPRVVGRATRLSRALPARAHQGAPDGIGQLISPRGVTTNAAGARSSRRRHGACLDHRPRPRARTDPTRRVESHRHAARERNPRVQSRRAQTRSG